MIRYARYDSPLGPMIAVANDDGLTNVDFVGAKYERKVGPDWLEDPSAPALSACIAQLAEYFAGRRKSFDLPLAPDGSTFQKRCVFLVTGRGLNAPGRVVGSKMYCSQISASLGFWLT